MKSLAVLVPNYNHARYLTRSLSSIINQSRLPDEIIICDDASTDESLEIINEFAKKSCSIRVIRNDKNLGVMQSIRKLANECRSDLILPCAADDELCLGFVESIIQCVEKHPNLGLFLGRMSTRVLNHEGEIIKEHEIRFNWSGSISSEEFQAAPSFIDPWIGFGISACAVYQRCDYLETLKLSGELGPKSDILERLYIASKRGMYIQDVPGAIFYQVPGSFSRNHENDIGATLDHAKYYIALLKSIQHPDLIKYFPRKLRSKLSTIWFKKAFNLIKKKVLKETFPVAFDKLNLPGKYPIRLIGNLPFLGACLQLKWFKLCLKRRFRI